LRVQETAHVNVRIELMTSEMPSENRRPIKARQQAWVHWLAHVLVGRGMSPNQMSAASVVAAVLGAAAYGGAVAAPPARAACLVAAAIFIQLRLLANLLDGLMAVEEGRKTPTGVLYNEFPDRIADTVLLAATGYASGWPDLGWLAAVLAVATAYVRAFGGALGYEQDFSGPMAKQHRMFTLTAGTLVAAFAAVFVAVFVSWQTVLAATLGVIVLGCAATLFRRTQHLARRLRDSSHD
jgi:phosphatidylglycerophosphate synthase